jgi:hypothetical protein
VHLNIKPKEKEKTEHKSNIEIFIWDHDNFLESKLK